VIGSYWLRSKKPAVITESIGTVAAKDIQKLPLQCDAAMQGRVSGVQISNVDGSRSPVSVRVRGVEPWVIRNFICN
jgi:hypothetical protein